MSESLKYDIVILTTSIDRWELHNEVFPNTLRYLDGLKCKWIITMNNICNDIQKTKDNFKSLLKNYDVEIHTYETGGTKMDFMHSCEKLSELGNEYNPSFGYFWLEDDWQIKDTSSKLKDDLENYLSDTNCYISLNGRDELSFNPGIWSNDLYKTMIYEKLQKAHLAENYGNQKVMNPERICVYPKERWTPTVKNFKSIKRYHARDFGTKWQEKNLNGIKTWKLV